MCAHHAKLYVRRGEESTNSGVYSGTREGGVACNDFSEWASEETSGGRPHETANLAIY